MTFRSGLIGTVATLGLFFAVAAANADTYEPGVFPINPGQSVSLSAGATSYASTLYASQIVPFGGGQGPSGYLFEYVSNSPVDNPYSHDDTAFEYVIAVTSGNVASISIPDFGSLLTSVGYCNAASPGALACPAGNFPVSATRSGSGDAITFSWSTPITSNDDNGSGIFNVWTNTPDYTDPGSIVITDSNGDTSLVSSFFSPVPTPLPAALPLFAAGLGALSLLGWRRKRASRSSVSQIEF